MKPQSSYPPRLSVQPAHWLGPLLAGLFFLSSGCTGTATGNNTAVAGGGDPGRLTIKFTAGDTVPADARVWVKVFQNKKVVAVQPRLAELSGGKAEFIVQTPDSEGRATGVPAFLDGGSHTVYAWFDLDDDQELDTDDQGLTRSVTINGATSLTLTENNLSEMTSVAITVSEVIEPASCRPLSCRWLEPGGDGTDPNAWLGFSASPGIRLGSASFSSEENDPLLPGTYDLYCLIDIDGDGQPTAGDYTYSATNRQVTTDSTTMEIASGSFTQITEGKLATVDLELVSGAVFDTDGTAHDLQVLGNTAYVADGASGLAILDLSDLAEISALATLDTAGDALDTHICGDYAYIADNANGLVIANINNPTAPQTTATLATGGNAVALFAYGDYVYVADDTSGLVIVDVSDPASPTTSGSSASSDPRDVFVSGSYAFVADGTDGLNSFDISDPASPGTKVSQATTGTATGLSISGGIAFVADGSNGLQLIDVSDPATMADLGAFSTLQPTSDAEVWGDFAYMANGAPNAGVAAIDYSNTSNLTGASGYTSTADVSGIYVQGNYVYAARGADGIAVIGLEETEASAQ